MNRVPDSFIHYYFKLNLCHYYFKINYFLIFYNLVELISYFYII